MASCSYCAVGTQYNKSACLPEEKPEQTLNNASAICVTQTRKKASDAKKAAEAGSGPLSWYVHG